jgi:large subunit ribosomal protein L10
MSTVRSEKEAVVAEIREKLQNSDAAILTEYRGLTVSQLAQLRNSLRGVGAEYRVYKNTLARFAAREAGAEGLDDLLIGPCALTFVHGDVAATSKTLKEFSKTNPLLVIRGGVIANKAVTAKDIETLADLPPREVMLSQLAGLMQAPLVKTAGLLQALPRNTAYGLKALIDQKEKEAA